MLSSLRQRGLFLGSEEQRVRLCSEVLYILTSLRQCIDVRDRNITYVAVRGSVGHYRAVLNGVRQRVEM